MKIRELGEALDHAASMYSQEAEVVVIFEEKGDDPSFWTDCEVVTTIAEDGDLRIHVKKVE